MNIHYKNNINDKNLNENREKNNYYRKKRNYKNYIKDILKTKRFNYLDELINWIKQIKKYNHFINKIKKLYFSSTHNNNYDNKIYNDILSWINQNMKKNNENKIYKIYCKEIMKKNNLNNIKEFKNFMSQILEENKQNTEFLKDMKKIFRDNFIPKPINGNNFNDVSYGKK